MTESIFVAGATDDAFCMGMAVMVTSLAMNTKASSLDFFLIDAGLSTQNRRQISKTVKNSNVTLHWLSPEVQRYHAAPISGHISKASYFRLSLAALLPESVERVLHLDADMVVLDDIQKIWKLGPPEKVLRAVRDQNIWKVSDERGLRNFQALEIDPDAGYFNAGLLDLNLKSWHCCTNSYY